MKKSFIVESDCLDIVQRIKTIDRDYFVEFNLQTEKFELHHAGQGKGTYCLTFPFDVLDERAYLHVLKTKVQNSDALFEEMEKQNKLLEKRQINQILNGFKERMYDG